MGTGNHRPTCSMESVGLLSVSVDLGISFAECLINESSCSLADSPDLDQ
jgi:hypothetical protein